MINKLSILFCFIGLICVQNNSHAQKYPVSLVTALRSDGSSEIVRERSYQVNIHSAGKATVEYVEAVTYFKSPDIDDVQLVTWESPMAKIKNIEGHIYDAQGKHIRSNKKSDIKKYGSPNTYEFTDTRYKILNMGIAETPFTVEYRYKKEYDGFFMMPNWTIQDIGEAVEHTSYSIQYPSDYGFSVHPTRVDCKPSQFVKNGKQQWEAEFSNLEYIQPEEGHPYFGNTYKAVEFSQKDIVMGEYEGGFSSWKDFSQFIYSVNEGREQLTAAQAQTVRDVLKNCKGDTRSKITCLYQYMQENYRYVSVQLGIGGWQTMEAKKVMDQKYGDCKALSYLMKGMLEVAGIPAHTALVYGGRDGAPDYHADYAKNYFNHCILYIPREDMWLECTSQDAPPGYLGAFTSNRHALLLTKEGGELLETPQAKAEEHQIDIVATVSIEPKGNAAMKMKQISTGQMQDRYRYIKNHLQDAEYERAMLKSFDFKVQSLNSMELIVDKNSASAVLELDAVVRRFALKSGKRIFIPISKLDKWERDFSSDQERTMPFELDYAYKKTMVVDIEIPEDYEVEGLPESVDLQEKYGNYSLQIDHSTPNTIQIKRIIEMPQLYLEAEEFDAANDFFEKASKLDAAKIILREKRT